MIIESIYRDIRRTMVPGRALLCADFGAGAAARECRPACAGLARLYRHRIGQVENVGPALFDRAR